MAASSAAPGLVAAGHPAVAEAAAAVLAAGGNAYDAAIAAGFAGAVAEPGLTSLAGGGFLLARTAAGEEVLFDFFVDTPGRGLPDADRRPRFEPVDVRFPAAVQRFHCGLGSVAVPGTLAGYLHVHRRLGRLPLEALVAPAARLAADGVALPPRQAAVVALLEPILRHTPAVEAIFAPNGRMLGAGDTIRNPELATFLARLATSPDGGLTAGSDGDRLVEAMADGGGLVTADDLAAYRVVEREPLATTYRGRRVLTNPPPSFGGRLLALALDWLEETGPPSPFGSPDAAATLVEVMAEVDRRRDAEEEPGSQPPRPRSIRGTTHVSVADAEGNVAAMSTSNGECSGDMWPGTGILLNNMLGEDDLHPGGFHAAPPGVRVASMMSPTVVLDAGGAASLVLGSGGSKRIRTAILQVLSAVVDGGLDVDAAVQAPRLHWDGDHTELEPGFRPAVAERLARYGPVVPWPDRDLFFGGVHAVAPAQGAAGDPRRDGAARRVEGASVSGTSVTGAGGSRRPPPPPR